MSLISTIRDTMRTKVLSSATGLGEAWSYRAITSAPTEQVAPTWATWATADALFSKQHLADIADPRSGKITQRVQAFLRFSDAIVLPIGSQVSIDQTTLWAVDEMTSSGGGTTQYLIGRSPAEAVRRPTGGGG